MNTTVLACMTPLISLIYAICHHSLPHKGGWAGMLSYDYYSQYDGHGTMTNMTNMSNIQCMSSEDMWAY